MTETENAVPLDDSDEDIYKDVSEFHFGNSKVDINTQQYEEKINKLNEEIITLKAENEVLKNHNTVLEKNLSILLKTAQAEVKRKDSMIEELRVQVDSLVFRKNVNKLTKDQYTNTEEKLFITNDSESKEYKYAREIKSSKSGKDHKLFRKEEKKSTQENAGCDNKRKTIYSCKEYEKSKATHAEGNSNFFDNKDSSYSLRERNESSASFYKRSRRDHSKHSSEERKRHHRRSDHRYSPYRERNLRRTSIKDKDSGDRLSRSSRRGRSRSPPRDHLRNAEEKSPEKQKIATFLFEENSKNRQMRRKDSNLNKNCLRKKSSSPERENNQYKDDKTDMKSLKTNLKNSAPREKKSVEFQLGVNNYSNRNHSIHTTKLDSEISSVPDELEDGEYVEENSTKTLEHQEDWKLSFRNERSVNEKPMTLYSKRMLNKLSVKSSEENVNKLAEKKNHIIVAVEKEPGELTDDESIVEKSKEFQEVTQAAVIESRALDLTPIKNKKLSKKKSFNSSSRDQFQNEIAKEPRNVTNKTENIALESISANNLENIPVNIKPPTDKSVECSTEFREVIEFSPFKNNYKLIEISPLEAPKSTYSLSNQNKKLSSRSSSQNAAEKSIFNLLSRLSGIPLDSGGTVQSEASEALKIETESTSLFEKDNIDSKQLQSNANHLKLDEKAENKSESIPNRKSSQKKSISIESYLSKKREKENTLKESSMSIPKDKLEVDQKEAAEEIEAEDVSPGEATQFLNFFLLTSSPSKPILPAEEEKLLKQSQDKHENNLLQSKTESFSTGNGCKMMEQIDKSKDSSLSSKVKKNKSSAPSAFKDNTAKMVEKDISIKYLNEKEIKKGIENNDDRESLHDNSNVNPQVKSKKEKESKTEKNKRKRDTSKKETSDLYEARKKPKNDSNSEDLEGESGGDSKIKEDISFFEFFKPIVKKDEMLEKEMGNVSNADDIKMTTTMSVTGVVRLETPSKCVEKLKNVMINEHTVYQVSESHKNASYSPAVNAKMVEMTPRRMLKNDLMLTDSEDDCRPNVNLDAKDVGKKIEHFDTYSRENSDCESDSGASDFVDQL